MSFIVFCFQPFSINVIRVFNISLIFILGQYHFFAYFNSHHSFLSSKCFKKIFHSQTFLLFIVCGKIGHFLPSFSLSLSLPSFYNQPGIVIYLPSFKMSRIFAPHLFLTSFHSNIPINALPMN